MGFRRRSQGRLFLDETVQSRRPAPYPVAASQSPSLEYASSISAMNDAPRVPMVIAPIPYPSLSPWRKDVRFAMGLVALVLGLNLGLYYVFNYPSSGSMERLQMNFSQQTRHDPSLSLEERVLTYSSRDSHVIHEEVMPASAAVPRRPEFPSLAK